MKRSTKKEDLGPDEKTQGDNAFDGATKPEDFCQNEHGQWCLKVG
ncbi:hypothetical protein [Psychromonas sp. SP041]|nr:hypothetical protein [Psychromonas sp. SP041]